MALIATTAPVQGKHILLQLSIDNGVTYKSLVCLTKQGREISTPVNETITQCGVAIGVGLPKESISVEGAINVVPPAETHVSYKELKQWVREGRTVMVKQSYSDAPGIVDEEDKAVLTDVKMDAPVENIATFSATIKIF